jgi:hypothetical protein
VKSSRRGVIAPIRFCDIGSFAGFCHGLPINRRRRNDRFSIRRILIAAPPVLPKLLAALFVLDLSADYQLDSQTTLTFYAAHAGGKGVVRNLFPDGRNASLVYIEATRRF